MIELQKVTKKYGNFTAVDDISFKIQDGDVVGFLGPNGAGKSTTMSMITGYIEPTQGTIIVNGYDINQKAKKAKEQIGYMPENVPLYPELTVKEFITYMAELKLVKSKNKKLEVQKAIQETGLDKVQGKLIKNLSRGYKQRVSLAGALVGNPPILILDEPTVGLDPNQVVEIRNLIKNLGKDHTILVSSHILSEINQMCNKVIIIDNGKIIKIDETQNIETESTNNSKEIIVTVEEEGKTELKSIQKEIPEITNIEFIKENDNEKIYNISYTGQEDIRKKLFKSCVSHDITIIEMKKKEATLEDAFIRLTKNESETNKKSDSKPKKNKGGKK